LFSCFRSAPQRPVVTEDDLAGRSRAELAAGSNGKLFLCFGAMAVEGDRAWLFRVLALAGVLNAAIGGWYYLRVLAKMYLQTPVRPLERPRGWPGLAALWACAPVTLVLEVYPRPLLQVAERAARPRLGPGTQVSAEER
jgi:NADH:ubiquinone oxidoreductase subunit 2 (subunit N)